MNVCIIARLIFGVNSKKEKEYNQPTFIGIREEKMALDRFGRKIHYLRISLTDHCNLRCVYCMPEDMTFRPNAEMLQDDEILLLARVFADLGFDKSA